MGVSFYFPGRRAVVLSMLVSLSALAFAAESVSKAPGRQGDGGVGTVTNWTTFSTGPTWKCSVFARQINRHRSLRKGVWVSLRKVAGNEIRL
ncbi:hypothetical protein ACLK19_06815 [Escherichia coli]